MQCRSDDGLDRQLLSNFGASDDSLFMVIYGDGCCRNDCAPSRQFGSLKICLMKSFCCSFDSCLLLTRLLRILLG